MFSTYAKAVVASIVAGLGTAAAAAADGITLAEGLGIATAFFVALAAVWATPNQP